MKIALLSFEYPPETGYGGIGTYTWYQARALVKLGHDVDVLAGSNQPASLGRFDHDGVRVFRFRQDNFLMKGFQLLNKFRLWWTRNRLENALNMFSGFRALSKENEYDLIEMPECGAEGLLINYFATAPVLIRLHSPSRLIMPYYDVRRSDTYFCSLLEQLGIRRATTFTSCSNFLSGEAARKLKIRKPIGVIPNGIDLSLFDQSTPVDVHQTYGIPRGKFLILFSGRIEPRKGSHLLKEIVVRILKNYDVSFVIAGQDLFQHMTDDLIPYWQSIRMKGSFHFLGRLSQPEVRSLMLASDVFLLPSIWENCPYSALEAMAARCALVSTDHGGMPEIVEDGKNGLLARNGDVDSYVSCLQRLIEDRLLTEQLGEAGRQTTERSHTDVRIATLSTRFYLQHIGREPLTKAEPVSPV